MINKTSRTDFEEDVELMEEGTPRVNQSELEEYEQRVPMTPEERRALRKWVADGHSVYETPCTRYVCLYGADSPQDFLDGYRQERDRNKKRKPLTDAGRMENLKESIRYALEGKDRVFNPWEEDTGRIRRYFRKMNRETFYLWMFLSEQDLREEAREFLEENMDQPIPFEEEDE